MVLLAPLLLFYHIGNYGLGLQTHGILDLMGLYRETGDLYQAIIAVFETMPMAKIGLILTGGYYDRFLCNYVLMPLPWWQAPIPTAPWMQMKSRIRR